MRGLESLDTAFPPKHCPLPKLGHFQHGLIRPLPRGSELGHSDTDGLVCVSPLHSF